MADEQKKSLLDQEQILDIAHSLFDKYKEDFQFEGQTWPVMERIDFIKALRFYSAKVKDELGPMEVRIEQLEQMQEEKICPKCGNGTKQWPNWEEWQERLLPILNRFIEEAPASLNYGDVWAGIRKLVVGPMEARIKTLEREREELKEENGSLRAAIKEMSLEREAERIKQEAADELEDRNDDRNPNRR